MKSNASNQSSRLIGHSAEIVAAYITRNHIRPAELPALIATMHDALRDLGSIVEPAKPALEKPMPAQVRKSIMHDALRSFEDGKTYKTLKRHLATRGLSPDAYRAKWGLPSDYPMTAPSYSEARSALAKGLKLGRIKLKRVGADQKSTKAEAGGHRPKRSSSR